MRRVAAVLVHHPVVDRQGEIVTTAITNLDLHDIARSAFTFGLSDFFVAHPVTAQRDLALRVRTHWTSGSGARRIPDRKPPMEIVRIVESLEVATAALAELGERPETWVTSAAKPPAGCLGFADARARLGRDGPPVLLVFGTGWGLAPSLMEAASARLEPVSSPRRDGFNHLSVRAAAAITFDRLLGRR